MIKIAQIKMNTFLPAQDTIFIYSGPCNLRLFQVFLCFKTPVYDTTLNLYFHHKYPSIIKPSI